MDAARFIRLQGAVRAAAGAITEGSAIVGAGPMHESYVRLRAEVRTAIPDDDVEEFDRVCPEKVPAFAANNFPAEQAAKFHAARGLLEQMAGWLDGYVRIAQMQAEADAYAAARVKDERGTGFRQPARAEGED